jgi:hypothetical protein
MPQRYPSPRVVFVLEVRLVFHCIREACGPLRAWMGHENQRVLAFRHLHQVRWAAQVVYLAVGRVDFYERIDGLAVRHVKQRLGDQHIRYVHLDRFR